MKNYTNLDIKEIDNIYCPICQVQLKKHIEPIDEVYTNFDCPNFCFSISYENIYFSYLRATIDNYKVTIDPDLTVWIYMNSKCLYYDNIELELSSYKIIKKQIQSILVFQ